MGYRGLEASLGGQMVKNLPAMWGIQVQSQDREDPLEKGLVSTPVLLPEESHGQRNLAGYGPCGHKGSDMTEPLTHTHTHTTGVGGLDYPA